jgi:hypothetical protein
MEIDWSKAPEGSEFYANNYFWKVNEFGNEVFYNGCYGWCVANRAFSARQLPDYEENPETKPTQEWPTERRIDIIATNGGDGEHYDKLPKTSAEFLSECLRVQTERGKQYDASGTGERSFAAAAAAFNAATGKSLTGSDVCLLLTMVKLVRQYSSPDRLHQDSLLDGVSYMSLWAEELTKELGK